MSRRLNIAQGLRFRPGVTDRYEAIRTKLPSGFDLEGRRRDFEAHIEALNAWRAARGQEPVGDQEQQEMWTLYSLGRADENWAAFRARTAAVQREMNGDSSTLPDGVHVGQAVL